VLGIFILFCYFSLEEIEISSKEIALSSKISTSGNYYAILKIPKINLSQEIFPTSSPMNNVDKNILLHDESILPSVSPSHVILASHSGTSNIAYFKNLYKLKVNDLVYFYYNDYLYTYEIMKIEEQPKTGTLYLSVEYTDILTLITCTKNNNQTQTIYYSKLQNKENIVKN
ncbi:MAG: sortase, partial [Bacilli bacterium]|nr:sortase [Bacilli bacterium]